MGTDRTVLQLIERIKTADHIQAYSLDRIEM
jgi:hypothetical protein